jgi:hypothetical protein
MEAFATTGDALAVQAGSSRAWGWMNHVLSGDELRTLRDGKSL